MDGINLINDNTVEPVILTTEQLESVSTFKTTLETNGTVSRKDVLSLEEFLGVNIVTSVINSKKLTSFPSLTKYEEVLECVSDYADSYEPVTNFMVLEKAKYLAYHLREMVYRLKAIASVNNKDFLDKAVSDEYAYKMHDGVLVNLSDIPLLDIVGYEYHYLSSITSERKALDLIEAYSDDGGMPTGLMILTNDTLLENIYYRPAIVSITDVTLRDVIKSTKSGDAIPYVVKLLDMVERDINDLVNGRSWDIYDSRELEKSYKRYESISNLLFDKRTMSLLTFIRNENEEIIR